MVANESAGSKPADLKVAATDEGPAPAFAQGKTAPKGRPASVDGAPDGPTFSPIQASSPNRLLVVQETSVHEPLFRPLEASGADASRLLSAEPVPLSVMASDPTKSAPKPQEPPCPIPGKPIARSEFEKLLVARLTQDTPDDAWKISALARPLLKASSSYNDTIHISDFGVDVQLQAARIWNEMVALQDGEPEIMVHLNAIALQVTQVTADLFLKRSAVSAVLNRLISPYERFIVATDVVTVEGGRVRDQIPRMQKTQRAIEALVHEVVEIKKILFQHLKAAEIVREYIALMVERDRAENHSVVAFRLRSLDDRIDSLRLSNISALADPAVLQQSHDRYGMLIRAAEDVIFSQIAMWKKTCVTACNIAMMKSRGDLGAAAVSLSSARKALLDSITSISEKGSSQ
jgi:hypothetical protein